MSYAVSQLMAIARSTALAQAVDPALFMAVLEHESSWQWDAIRYEPAFYTRYVEPQKLANLTEATARAFSWGLGQIMGQTARELGFTGTFISELLDPEIGCDFACRKLKSCIVKHPGDTNGVLESYNGGSDPNYAAAVMANYGKYQVTT